MTLEGNPGSHGKRPQKVLKHEKEQGTFNDPPLKMATLPYEALDLIPGYTGRVLQMATFGLTLQHTYNRAELIFLNSTQRRI